MIKDLELNNTALLAYYVQMHNQRFIQFNISDICRDLCPGKTDHVKLAPQWYKVVGILKQYYTIETLLIYELLQLR